VTAESPHRIRFRLVHLLYVVAMLASSLSMFSGAGIVIGLIIVSAWAFVFLSKSRPHAFVTVCMVLLLISCTVSLLLPATRVAREAARRTECVNNLKQIALGLQNYEDQCGSLPPAYIADENGKPKHSWRVLILPYIEQGNLYDAYDFNEPWDGPNNRKLAAQMPRCYDCPSHAVRGGTRNTYTSYFAVVGPQTAWPNEKSVQLKDFADGTSNTILVIEGDSRSVNWMEPKDLSYDEAIRLATSNEVSRNAGHWFEDFFHESYFGRNVALADGSVRMMIHGSSSELWASLLTINDGRKIDFDDDSTAQPVRRLKLGNCFRLAIFVLLLLLPLPWVWIHPHGDESRMERPSSGSQPSGLQAG
jgi:hypothetical protein